MNDQIRFVETLVFLKIVMIKYWVEFNLTFFGMKKWDCVREMFSFLPMINISVTIGLSFLLLTISTIISLKVINISRFYLDCIFQYFCKYHPYHISFEYLIKDLESFNCFKPVLPGFIIENWYFDLYGPLGCK